jgi:hypothetical protein
MKKIKLNLRKIGLLAIVSVGLLTMSCEKEELEIEESEAVEEQVKPEVLPVTYKYNYHYNGQIFTEDEWTVKATKVDNSNFSMIGLNDVVYVFDDESKAILFQDTQLPVLMDTMADTTFLYAEDTTIGSGVVKFKVELYKHKNYSGRYSFNYVETVLRKRTSWGYIYLDNNEYERNLPSGIDEETSSYRVTLIQNTSVKQMSNATGSITGAAIPLRMYTKLRLGRLSDGGAEWKKLLTTNNSTHQDSDFSNNRIWGVFGLVTWNDRIRSFNVEFR